jgi:lipopolysaccharide transport system ATP-binding protein
VLFVSHQMAAIQRLCDRVYLMKGGRVHSEGPTATVIGEYLSEAKRARTVDLRGWKDRVTTGEAKIVSVSITDATGGSGTVPFGGELVVTINALVKAPQLDPIFGLLVHDAMGQNLIDTRSCHDGLRLGRVVGPVSVEVHVPNVSLYPGRYLLSPWMTDAGGTRDLDYPRRSCAFDVLPSVSADGDLTCGSRFGIFFVPSRWKRSTFESEDQVPRHTRVAGDRFVSHT